MGRAGLGGTDLAVARTRALVTSFVSPSTLGFVIAFDDGRSRLGAAVMGCRADPVRHGPLILVSFFGATIGAARWSPERQRHGRRLCAWFPFG